MSTCPFEKVCVVKQLSVPEPLEMGRRLSHPWQNSCIHRAQLEALPLKEEEGFQHKKNLNIYLLM